MSSHENQFTDKTNEELLEEYMEQYGKEGHALPKELIQYAVECGGSDNITAAVIYNG